LFFYYQVILKDPVIKLVIFRSLIDTVRLTMLSVTQNAVPNG